MKLKYILYMFALPWLLPLAGCENGGGDTGGESFGPEMCGVTLRVGQKESNAEADEMMHSLRLIAVNEFTGVADTVIDKVLDNADGAQCDLTLKEGRYIIYAFANFDAIAKTDATSKMVCSIRKGDAPDLQQIEKGEVELPEAADGDAARNLMHEGRLHLPMSGRIQIAVRRQDDLAFEMYVHRMMCRVDVTLHNPTGTKVNVKKLVLGDFHPGYIYLLPPDNVNDANGKPELPVTGISPDYPTDYADVLIPEGYSGEEITLPPRYVNESSPGEAFTLEAEVERGQDEGTQQPEAKESVKLRLGSKSLMRNTVLDVHVYLYRYLFDIVSVRSNPPIGGYPPMVKKGINEFTCTFSHAGAFTMETEMRRYGRSDADGVPVATSLDRMAVDDPQGIFTREPEYTDGILEKGRMGYNTGTAVITLDFKVKEESPRHDYTVSAERVLTVKINVVRE